MMEDELRDLLTSATAKGSPNAKSMDSVSAGGKNALLQSLKKGLGEGGSQNSPCMDAQIKVVSPELVATHMAISNFKTVTVPRDFCPQLVSANESYIAYVVGTKKVRLLDQSTGQKGMMANQKDSPAGIVAVGLKGNHLASLTEQGELLIGSIYSESSDSLGFDPIVSLTFPDLQPSRGLAWGSGQRNVLAAWGRSPATFIVWLEPKPVAVELPHSFETPVESVVFYGEGKFVAVADLETVECFEIDHESKAFRKVAQLSFTGDAACGRVCLFEDKETDFVIAAISAADQSFMACPVVIGRDLAWISSSTRLPRDMCPTLPILYDPLLQVFLLGGPAGAFQIFALRTDSPGFALINGAWKEPQPALSLAFCPGLRGVEAGIHLPVYAYQSEWVSFYGLRLPAEPVEEKLPAAPVFVPSSVPVPPSVAAPVAPIPKAVPLPKAAPMPTAPVMSEPASRPAPVKTEELRDMVKEIMMKHLVPGLEASFGDLFAQVQSHVATITAPASNNTKALEAKIDALTKAVEELKRSVAALPSADQIASVVSPAQTPALPKESFDDLMKAELEDLRTKESAAAAMVKALSLANLGILVWLLKRLDPEATLEELPPQVMLSFIQQLGSDLSDDPELKVNWLAEIFTVFSPAGAADPAITGQVLEDVFASLRDLLARTPTDSALHKQVKTVIRLVRLAL